MTLTRSVLPVPRLRARHIVLGLLTCATVLLASQQCAGTTSSRLDATIARDPLPRSPLPWLWRYP